MIRSLAFILAVTQLPALLHAYPLDGYPETGIRRVEGTRLANEGIIPGRKQPAGALLSTAEVDLRLLDYPNLDLPAPDPGEAGGEVLGETVDIGAWLPVMNRNEDLADTGLPSVPNIARAMSLVPRAVALFFGAFRPHYRLKDIHLAISQAQAEFIASRVSALNACFY